LIPNDDLFFDGELSRLTEGGETYWAIVSLELRRAEIDFLL
jgi:hypothetical protein